jgi:hypothetical protein
LHLAVTEQNRETRSQFFFAYRGNRVRETSAMIGDYCIRTIIKSNLNKHIYEDQVLLHMHLFKLKDLLWVSGENTL